MNHLTKEQLEKLKAGDVLECKVLLPSHPNYTKSTSYFIKIITIKLAENGYRIKTHLTRPENKMINIVELDRVFLKLTINGSFSKDGIHNPGPNYLKRKYYKI
jgi:hypothetical protein